MDNLAFHSAKALLMSAGGGLVVRKSLEAVGLRQPENPDIGLLPSLTPEELSEYLLDAGYDEPPHAPLIAGALPAPKPAAPASLLSIAVRKTLAEPLVLSSDRLTPSALAAWACGAAAALLLIKLMQLSCAERGAQYTVRMGGSHGGRSCKTTPCGLRLVGPGPWAAEPLRAR